MFFLGPYIRRVCVNHTGVRGGPTRGRVGEAEELSQEAWAVCTLGVRSDVT